jgi:hypothetical protein
VSDDRSGIPLHAEIRILGDALRTVADEGLRWSAEEPFHAERYERARVIAAKVFGLADTRGHEEIERTVFEHLTHRSPVAVGEGAVVEDGRVLLIRRSDDGLWALPGGGFNVGETPARRRRARSVRGDGPRGPRS